MLSFANAQEHMASMGSAPPMAPPPQRQQVSHSRSPPDRQVIEGPSSSFKHIALKRGEGVSEGQDRNPYGSFNTLAPISFPPQAPQPEYGKDHINFGPKINVKPQLAQELNYHSQHVKQPLAPHANNPYYPDYLTRLEQGPSELYQHQEMQLGDQQRQQPPPVGAQQPYGDDEHHHHEVLSNVQPPLDKEKTSNIHRFMPINRSYRRILPKFPDEITYQNFGSPSKVRGGLGARNDLADLVHPLTHTAPKRQGSGKLLIEKPKVGAYSPTSHDKQEYFGTYNQYVSNKAMPNKDMNAHIGLSTKDIEGSSPRSVNQVRGVKRKNFFPGNNVMNAYYNREAHGGNISSKGYFKPSQYFDSVQKTIQPVEKRRIRRHFPTINPPLEVAFRGDVAASDLTGQNLAKLNEATPTHLMYSNDAELVNQQESLQGSRLDRHPQQNLSVPKVQLKSLGTREQQQRAREVANNSRLNSEAANLQTDRYSRSLPRRPEQTRNGSLPPIAADSYGMNNFDMMYNKRHDWVTPVAVQGPKGDRKDLARMSPHIPFERQIKGRIDYSTLQAHPQTSGIHEGDGNVKNYGSNVEEFNRLFGSEQGGRYGQSRHYVAPKEQDESRKIIYQRPGQPSIVPAPY